MLLVLQYNIFPTAGYTIKHTIIWEPRCVVSGDLFRVKTTIKEHLRVDALFYLISN